MRVFAEHYCLLFNLSRKTDRFLQVANAWVRMTVQLFADEVLVENIVKTYPLMEMMVVSLERSGNAYLGKIEYVDQDNGTSHSLPVYDKPESIAIGEFRSWPFLSDINSVLSHKSVAMRFIENDFLRRTLFKFVSIFQFMNPRFKMGGMKFTDAFDSMAFLIESLVLDNCVFNLLRHLTDKNDTKAIAGIKLLVNTATLLTMDWYNSIDFQFSDPLVSLASAHLPLHRLLIYFLNHATRVLEIPSKAFQRTISVMGVAVHHPLRVIVSLRYYWQ